MLIGTIPEWITAFAVVIAATKWFFDRWKQLRLKKRQSERLNMEAIDTAVEATKQELDNVRPIRAIIARGEPKDAIWVSWPESATGGYKVDVVWVRNTDGTMEKVVYAHALKQIDEGSLSDPQGLCSTKDC